MPEPHVTRQRHPHDVVAVHNLARHRIRRAVREEGLAPPPEPPDPDGSLFTFVAVPPVRLSNEGFRPWCDPPAMLPGDRGEFRPPVFPP